jgi:hypothetical protein
VLVGLAALHAWLAQATLSAHGHENALRNGTLGIQFVLNALSPVNGWMGWIVGPATFVFGGIGIVRRWTTDRAARVFGAMALLLVPAGIAVGREYWALTYGAGIACFVPAGVVALTERYQLAGADTAP